jgi:hypothetical protein
VPRAQRVARGHVWRSGPSLVPVADRSLGQVGIVPDRHGMRWDLLSVVVVDRADALGVRDQCPGGVRLTTNVSFGSGAESPRTVTRNVCDVVPGGKLSVVDAAV